MNLIDIIGPVMVGPSSSHTAGAVRIGLISRRLLGEPVADAKIYMHGSFAATGKGHGTDRALGSYREAAGDCGGFCWRRSDSDMRDRWSYR